MKSWVCKIYDFYSRNISFDELQSYIGNGGSDVEWVEDFSYPECIDHYRYHSVQYLINNEHTLLLNKMVAEKINDEDFYRLIRFAVMHLEMKYICNEFDVNQNTVFRWALSRAIPLMYARPNIRKGIQKLIYNKYTPG